MCYCFWFILLVKKVRSKNPIPVLFSHNNSYSWVKKHVWVSSQLPRISFPRMHSGNIEGKRGYGCRSLYTYGVIDLGQNSIYHLITKSFCSTHWTHSAFLLCQECVILVTLFKNRWKVYFIPFLSVYLHQKMTTSLEIRITVFPLW